MWPREAFSISKGSSATSAATTIAYLYIKATASVTTTRPLHEKCTRETYTDVLLFSPPAKIETDGRRERRDPVSHVHRVIVGRSPDLFGKVTLGVDERGHLETHTINEDDRERTMDVGCQLAH